MKKLIVLLALLALVAGLSTSAFAGNALGKINSSWVNTLSTTVDTARNLTVTESPQVGNVDLETSLPPYDRNRVIVSQPYIVYGTDAEKAAGKGFSGWGVCVDWKQFVNNGGTYGTYLAYDWAKASSIPAGIPPRPKTGTIDGLLSWKNLTTMWSKATIDMTNESVSRAGFQLATWELCNLTMNATEVTGVGVRSAANGYLALLGTKNSDDGSYTGTSGAYVSNFVLLADTDKQIFAVGKAVPEASTLIGFGSALVMAGPGMIGWLKRRRS